MHLCDEEAMSNTIPVKRVVPDAVLPTRAHPDDAGLDLYAAEDVVLGGGGGQTVRTGIALAIPPRHVGLVFDRSSMAKRGVKTAGGVIDAGYRGEVLVVLRNLTNETIQVTKGDRIAQLLIMPVATPAVLESSLLDETSRGANGFGSTGK